MVRINPHNPQQVTLTLHSMDYLPFLEEALSPSKYPKFKDITMDMILQSNFQFLKILLVLVLQLFTFIHRLFQQEQTLEMLEGITMKFQVLPFPTLSSIR